MLLVDYSSDSDDAPDSKRSKVASGGSNGRVAPLSMPNTAAPAIAGPSTRSARPDASQSDRAHASVTNGKNNEVAPKPPLKRALPRLPSSYAGPAALDNPAQHQGRKRVRAFVDGDYYAHVYVELDIPPKLRTTLDAMLATVRAAMPDVAVHSLLDPTSAPASLVAADSDSTTPPSPPRTLHISLTHPLPLRSDTRAPFLAAIRNALPRTPFKLSFTPTPTIYTNALPPPARRAFLALRVGAGAPALASCLTVLEPILARWHLPAYHAQPEFHASVAWALVSAAISGVSESAAGVALTLRKGDPLDSLVPAPPPSARDETTLNRDRRRGVDEGSRSEPPPTGNPDLSRMKSKPTSTPDQGPPSATHDPESKDKIEPAASSVAVFAAPTTAQHHAHTQLAALDDSAARAGATGASDPDATAPFAPSLLRTLEDRFARDLLDAQPRGGWDVSWICVKIGKEVVRIPL